MPEGLVVVTGAGGFIGSNIACALADDAGVVACDPFAHEQAWRYLAPARLYDIVRPQDLLGWLEHQAGRVSAIVHMGAITDTTETDVGKLIDNNIRFTLELWQHCATYGIAFIYASSAATYGQGSNGFRDDDAPEAVAALRPLNAYAWSKHVVDRRIVDDAAASRPTPPRWAGLKFFNAYGPNEGHKGSMRSVVHQIYPAAARGEAVKLFKSDRPEYPDGGQMRDFVYVKDCCAIVRNMLSAPTLSGIFNVGTGRARTFADLATAVFLAVGREPRIEYVDMPEHLRGRYQYFTEADTTKLREAGLAPTFHELEAGVEDYVRTALEPEFS